jgi:hypothetical protein
MRRYTLTLWQISGWLYFLPSLSSETEVPMLTGQDPDHAPTHSRDHGEQKILHLIVGT